MRGGLSLPQKREQPEAEDENEGEDDRPGDAAAFRPVGKLLREHAAERLAEEQAQDDDDDDDAGQTRFPPLASQGALASAAAPVNAASGPHTTFRHTTWQAPAADAVWRQRESE